MRGNGFGYLHHQPAISELLTAMKRNVPKSKRKSVTAKLLRQSSGGVSEGRSVTPSRRSSFSKMLGVNSSQSTTPASPAEVDENKVTRMREDVVSPVLSCPVLCCCVLRLPSQETRLHNASNHSFSTQY